MCVSESESESESEGVRVRVRVRVCVRVRVVRQFMICRWHSMVEYSRLGLSLRMEHRVVQSATAHAKDRRVGGMMATPGVPFWALL